MAAAAEATAMVVTIKNNHYNIISPKYLSSQVCVTLVLSLVIYHFKSCSCVICMYVYIFMYIIVVDFIFCYKIKLYFSKNKDLY